MISDDRATQPQPSYRRFFVPLAVLLAGLAAENNSPIQIDGIEVLRLEVRTNVFGDFYIPANTQRAPGIILLGGSDGQPMTQRAALLASRGYAVLNLFYFGYGPLPKDFAKVPVEYLTNAVSWLQTHEHVDSARIGVIGHSRGTEAALLIATLRPDVRAVVAVAPSCVLWPAPGPSGYFRSAWSLNGIEMPCVPVRLSKGVGAFLKQITGEAQIEHRPLFEEALKNQTAVERATIPVEQIHAALLLISGKQDSVWPATPMAERIVERLRQHQHPLSFRHLAYDNAGHSFGLPGQPRTKNTHDTFKMGGTPAGNSAAATNSWNATLEFLHNELYR